MRNFQVSLVDRENAKKSRGGSNIVIAMSQETHRLLGAIRTYATPRIISSSDAIRLAIRQFATQVLASVDAAERAEALARLPAGIPPMKDAAGAWLRELSQDEYFSLSAADKGSYAAWWTARRAEQFVADRNMLQDRELGEVRRDIGVTPVATAPLAEGIAPIDRELRPDDTAELPADDDGL